MSIAEAKQIPIADVAARLNIKIDRHGKALCFNGHDTVPSLKFYFDTNSFYCFGCGIGGSVIDLVREYLHITTGEAISWLEKQYCVKKPKKRIVEGGGYVTPTRQEKTPCGASYAISGHSTSRVGTEYADIYAYFLGLLDADEAIKYLEGRGISRDITKRAGIKCIPQDMTDVKRRLRDRYDTDRLRDAGFINHDKTHFVFADHRLIIPYYDMSGNIINLQGRNIDTYRAPKYKFLSGITVPLYNIRALCNLAPGAPVYLCEGAIDALSCYQLHLEHPVAVAGVNNFRDEYFDILSPYKVIVASDKDAAGKALYLRVKKEYLKRGKTIYAIDYSKLKSDHNIAGEVKDLNDIVCHRKARRIVYSHLLGETYTIAHDGGALFESGVSYSRDELSKLEDVNPDALKMIHAIKRLFRGVLL